MTVPGFTAEVSLHLSEEYLLWPASMAETLAYKLPQRASRVKLAFAISYRTFPGWSRFAACRLVIPKCLACVSASTALVCSLRRQTYVSDRRTRSATKTACVVAMDYHQVAR